MLAKYMKRIPQGMRFIQTFRLSENTDSDHEFRPGSLRYLIQFILTG